MSDAEVITEDTVPVLDATREGRAECKARVGAPAGVAAAAPALMHVSKALAQPMDSRALAEWIRENAAVLADAVEASGRVRSQDLARLILRGSA